MVEFSAKAAKHAGYDAASKQRRWSVNTGTGKRDVSDIRLDWTDLYECRQSSAANHFNAKERAAWQSV